MAQTLPAKRFLDVMKALWWAYRDELPKRDRISVALPGAGQQVWSPYLFPADYGDASPMFREGAGASGADYPDERGPGFPQALGAPDFDALIIETAVKDLGAWCGQGFGPDDQAGLMCGMDHMDRTWSLTPTGWCEITAVDHIAAGIEAVANMATIVAAHARAATRPRWTRELPKPFKIKGGNGQPVVLIDETFIEAVDRKGVYYRRAPKIIPPGAITYRRPVPSPAVRKGVYREGTYSPLVYRPRPATVVAERAEYAAWRMGLELIHKALEGRLTSIATLPPAAAWRPWAGEAEAHGNPPHLFAHLRDSPYRRETREQQAAKRRSAQRRRLGDRDVETRPVGTPPNRRRSGGQNVT